MTSREPPDNFSQELAGLKGLQCDSDEMSSKEGGQAVFAAGW